MIESVPARRSGPASYTVADDGMAAGSTFGGPRAMLVLKPTGAIEKMFAPQIGSDVFGSMVLHYWDPQTEVPLRPRRGTFSIHPEHQTHEFVLSNGVRVRERIFVLSSGAQLDGERDPDPPAAYLTLELTNLTQETVHVAAYACVELRGSIAGVTAARFERRARGFVSAAEDGRLVRIAASTHAPSSAEVTLDAAKASAITFPGELSGAALETEEHPLGIFHFDLKLEPDARWRNSFVLTFAQDGEAQALKQSAALPGADDAYGATAAFFEAVMGDAIVLTPDEEVNRGVQWAKANILRVQSHTQQGWAFVNDPTRSNNAVARDTAWYALGADYLTPAFTGETLAWFAEHLEERGMVVEYYDIRNGETEDYGLNINDDTPLLVIALWHHYCVTGDRAFLQRVWPNAKRCVEYILSQRDERGLVWCTADGQADWGIIGWRNVIKDYRLAGATTEANSECYAAIDTAAKIARTLGDAADAQRYAREAVALRAAINEHLLDKERKLYYLNIDMHGRKRTDVTGDLVFPVLFGVAETEVAKSIISRLSAQDFWTDAGMRTLPRNAINYSPTNGDGLFGGIWSGPTFWFACAASAFNQDFMAYALSASYEHYASDPLRNNTVPGQFCEWLHGETLTNQGMMLSPWFAPKYIWAAMEGAAGLNIAAETPSLHPCLPSTWNWIAARNVCVRGKPVSWLGIKAGDLRVYATGALEGVDAENVFEEDITGEVDITGEPARCVALRRSDRTIIFVGNTAEASINVGVTLRSIEGAHHIRRYDTLQNEWSGREAFDVRNLREGLQLEISRHGFAVFELHRSA